MLAKVGQPIQDSGGSQITVRAASASWIRALAGEIHPPFYGLSSNTRLLAVFACESGAQLNAQPISSLGLNE